MARGFGGVEFVQIKNLKETRRALKEIDKGLPKELKKALRPVARETVKESKAKAKTTFVHRKARLGIGHKSDAKGVSIKLDPKRYPDIFGQEFGGGLHGKGNPTSRGGYTTQFKAHTGSGSGAGYAVFPTIRRRQQRENPELVQRQIDAFVAKNF